ncbi:MAG: glycosyltransferase family 39 protein [Bacteroidia bacterium]
MKYSPFLRKVFSNSFMIVLLLFMLVVASCYMRFPGSLYNSIIINISDFLKTNLGSNGSIIKIETGLHKLSKLMVFLSFAFIAYLQFWKWLLGRLKENNNDNLSATYFNTRLVKQDWFIITGLTIAAILLRIFPITQSLWQDEIGVYKIFIEKGILSTVYPKSSMGSQPFMQIIVTLFINVFGVSELNLRLPVFLFAVFTVPLLYFVCIKISGQRILALVACLFLTIHSYHIYYSFQMRGYAIVIFLCILSTYLFIKLLYSYTKQTGILFILTNILMVYTHMWAIYYLISQQIVLVVILMYQLRKNNLPNTFSAHNIAAYFQSFIVFLLLIFIIYLPQIPVVLMNVLNENGIKILMTDYFYQVISTSHYLVAYSDNAVLVRLYVLTIVLVYLFVVKKSMPFRIIFYSSIILFFITAFANNPTGFFPRYLICELPLFIFISAEVIMKLWNSSTAINKSLSIILVIAFITLSFMGYHNTYRKIQNFKGAVEFVNNQNMNEDKIIVANSIGKTEIQYYDKKIIPLNSTEQLDSLIALNKNVYAITTLTRFAGRSAFLKDKDTQIKIERQFRRIKTFDGQFPVDVWYYQR